MKNKLCKYAVGGLTLLFFTAVLMIAYTGDPHAYLSFVRYIPGGDKTGHVFLLCFITLVFTWVLSFRAIPFLKLRMYYGVISVFTVITLEEFFQLLSPHRTFDPVDLSCNYLGIGLAFIAANFLEKQLNYKRDSA